MTRTVRLTVAAAAAVLVVLTPVLAEAGSPTTGPDSFSSTYQPVPKAQLRELATVPVKTLKTVGIGTTLRGRSYRPQRITAPALKKSGKPELVFIDAEFCPFCASVRWGLSVALDRFGAFKGITTVHSSTTDPVARNIQSVSYRYASYRSRFLAFRDIVNEDVNQKTVEPVPPHLKKIWFHYTEFGGYPFLYYAGKLVQLRSPLDPARLKGLSRPQIAVALKHPSSAIAKGVDGEANDFTAAICHMTGNKPGRVCNAKWIRSIESAFPKYRKGSTP